MRVRLLKDIRLVSLPTIKFLAGTTLETDSETAGKWIEKGFAMEDKSLDGAQETKIDRPIAKSVPKKAKAK